ncbi:MAG TPA: family 20 glycosylhydrolase [Nocardioides sp.]|nr:family 20 glycosylhydrolase [Nocardioides sp.]
MAAVLAVVLTVALGSLPGAPAAAGPGPAAAVPSEPPLIPRPAVVDGFDEAEPWVLPHRIDVYADPAARAVATALAGDLRTASGKQVRISAREEGSDLRIDVDPGGDYTVDGEQPGAESYVLDVTDDGVEITARSAHGAFNAVQTLRQLLPAWISADRSVTTSWHVPAVHIEDQPRFAYRGVMLDVARSFQDVDSVKRYIDTLSRLKMSRLHLHLADDQGWRIEITNKGRAAGDTIDYRRLTGLSGRTSMIPSMGYRNELGRSGYYTQEEYREIVEYARERFVTVVPEVDVPSHTNAALHAIPQLNTDRSLPAPNPETGVVDWNGTGSVGYSALDERHDPTYDFVRHVFRQLAEMTGGPLVHVGGDESHAMGHERYVDFVKRAVPAVQEATGVGVMGWTEYAEAGLEQEPGYWDGSVVQYWVGSADWVRDFVAKGGTVVVSAAGGAYLDMKYDPSTPIGLTWACSGDCDIPQYYGWEPTTTVQGGIAEEAVEGVEGPMWSETVRGEDQAFYLTLPRAAAILETGWTQADRKDLAGFADRLGRLGTHFTVNGDNFYETRRAVWDATVAGTDIDARRGSRATYDVGLVAAPGTKLADDRSSIVPDRVSDDGDPASDSTLSTPLTATLQCGHRDLPVSFAQDRPRDNLHGAGLYVAQVSTRFHRPTECTLAPSDGEPVRVRVGLDRHHDGDHQRRSHVRPRIRVGGGAGAVDAGTWVPFELRGFVPGEHIQIAIDGAPAYTLRAGEDGRFDRFALIPAATYDGNRVISAVQGERVAEDEVDVRSDLVPLEDEIDQSKLSVHEVSSEETVAEDGTAANVLDGDPSTIWHTQYEGAQPGFPHHITIDLGTDYDVTGLEYLPRQDGSNGRFKEYAITVSADGETWGEPVVTGEFNSDLAPQTVTWPAATGRYVRLTGLSSINGTAFGGAAEINLGGTPQ